MALNLAVRANQLLEKGPRVLNVGTAEFEIPEDVRVTHAQGGRIALVLHRGALHVFVARGELWVPPEILPALTRAYFGKRR